VGVPRQVDQVNLHRIKGKARTKNRDYENKGDFSVSGDFARPRRDSAVVLNFHKIKDKRGAAKRGLRKQRDFGVSGENARFLVSFSLTQPSVFHGLAGYRFGVAPSFRRLDREVGGSSTDAAKM
jgi:hypothetical protein